MKRLVSIMMFLLCMGIVSALPVEDVKLNNYVNDYTKTLSAEEISKLGTLAASLQQSGVAELAIVLVDNFGSLSKEEYAIAIAHGKLGDTKKDNGLLILVGLEVREYRIEVGYGLEGVLNDAKVNRFAREFLVPSLSAEQYGSGLILYSLKLHQELLPGVEVAVQAPSAPVRSGGFRMSPMLMFFIALFVLRGISGVANAKSEIGKSGKGKKNKSNGELFTAAIIASMFMRGGGRGGNLGGGGFGGFGGGGFGGGGGGGSF